MEAVNAGLSAQWWAGWRSLTPSFSFREEKRRAKETQEKKGRWQRVTSEAFLSLLPPFTKPLHPIITAM